MAAADSDSDSAAASAADLRGRTHIRYCKCLVKQYCSLRVRLVKGSESRIGTRLAKNLELVQVPGILLSRTPPGSTPQNKSLFCWFSRLHDGPVATGLVLGPLQD